MSLSKFKELESKYYTPESILALNADLYRTKFKELESKYYTASYTAELRHPRFVREGEPVYNPRIVSLEDVKTVLVGIVEVLDYPSSKLRELSYSVADEAGRNLWIAPIAVPAAFVLGGLAGLTSIISPKAWYETGRFAYSLVTDPRGTLGSMKEYYAENPFRLFSLSGELIGAAIGPKFVKIPVVARYRLVREGVDIRVLDAGELIARAKVEYPSPKLIDRVIGEGRLSGYVRENVIRTYAEYPELLKSDKLVRSVTREFFMETYERLPVKTREPRLPEYIQPRLELELLGKPSKSYEVLVRETGRLEFKGLSFKPLERVEYFVRTPEFTSYYLRDPDIIRGLYYKPGKVLEISELKFRGKEYELRGVISTRDYAYIPERLLDEISGKITKGRVREAKIEEFEGKVARSSRRVEESVRKVEERVKEIEESRVKQATVERAKVVELRRQPIAEVEVKVAEIRVFKPPIPETKIKSSLESKTDRAYEAIATKTWLSRDLESSLAFHKFVKNELELSLSAVDSKAQLGELVKDRAQSRVVELARTEIAQSMLRVGDIKRLFESRVEIVDVVLKSGQALRVYSLVEDLKLAGLEDVRPSYLHKLSKTVPVEIADIMLGARVEDLKLAGSPSKTNVLQYSYPKLREIARSKQVEIADIMLGARQHFRAYVLEAEVEDMRSATRAKLAPNALLVDKQVARLLELSKSAQSMSALLLPRSSSRSHHAVVEPRVLEVGGLRSVSMRSGATLVEPRVISGQVSRRVRLPPSPSIPPVALRAGGSRRVWDHMLRSVLASLEAKPAKIQRRDWLLPEVFSGLLKVLY
ncbi:MAG: hypothetical protein QXR02_06645 [Acidilobaceae archaeon]